MVTCWGHAARVWDADMAGPLLATAGEDGTCRLWDVADGSCAAVIQVGDGYSRGFFSYRRSLPLSSGCSVFDEVALGIRCAAACVGAVSVNCKAFSTTPCLKCTNVPVVYCSSAAHALPVTCLCA